MYFNSLCPSNEYSLGKFGKRKEDGATSPCLNSLKVIKTVIYNCVMRGAIVNLEMLLLHLLVYVLCLKNGLSAARPLRKS